MGGWRLHARKLSKLPSDMKSHQIRGMAMLLVSVTSQCLTTASAQFHTDRGRNSPAAPTRRIIGGSPAGNQYPWVVYISPIGGQEIFCTGQLVAPTWVLTAAHCIVDTTSDDYLSPGPSGASNVVYGCDQQVAFRSSSFCSAISLDIADHLTIED